MKNSAKKFATPICASIAVLLASGASTLASFTFDLRATAKNGTAVDPSQAKNLAGLVPGDTVTFTIYGQVTGAAGNAGLEGIGSTYFSLLADPNSLVKGNWSIGSVNAAYTAPASTGGSLVDTNSDGFFDRLGKGVGSATQNATTGFDITAIVSGNPTYTGTPITNGQEFTIATALFTVVQAPGGGLNVSVIPSVFTSGIGAARFAHKFSEDVANATTAANKSSGFNGLDPAANVANTGSVFAGSSVVLTAVPEPGVAVTLIGGVATLLGLRRRKR